MKTLCITLAATLALGVLASSPVPAQEVAGIPITTGIPLLTSKEMTDAQKTARNDALFSRGIPVTRLVVKKTPAHLINAIQSGDATVLHGLLTTDRHNPRALHKDGFSPMHYAVFYGTPEMVALLVHYGFDIDVGHKTDGAPPLTYGIWGEYFEMARTLIGMGAGVNVMSNFDQTSLMAAAHMGETSLVNLLLDKGADPLPRMDFPSSERHGMNAIEVLAHHWPELLESRTGKRLARVTAEHEACAATGGAMVLSGDTKMGLFAERVTGRASDWKRIAKLNELGEDKGYREGDCLLLP